MLIATDSSRRVGMVSPSGSNNRMPAETPSCVKAGSRLTAPSVRCSDRPMSTSKGCE